MLLPLLLALGPTFAEGFLSPRTSRPATDVAISLARARTGAALAVARTGQGAPGLTVVHLTQTHAGVPVDGAGLAVLVDAQGRARVMAGRLAELAGVATAPRLEPLEAVRLALLAHPTSVTPVDPRLARLVVLDRGAAARLAYRVALPPVPELVEAPVLYVDATDGRILHREDGVRFAKKARVFVENPVTTPMPSEVTLDAARDDVYPGSPVFDTYNCIDTHATVPSDLDGTNRQIHVCSRSRTAMRDAAGDWLFDASVQNQPDDKFVETHMFYHATRISDFFRTLGYGGRPEAIQLIGNFRLAVDTANPVRSTAWDPMGPMFPFDNAFFTPPGDLFGIYPLEQPTLIFGQGAADFAWDADVVYHEFTHSVVNQATMISWGRYDQDGIDVSQGAMNEAFADYFAAALAGNAAVGEYAGMGIGRAAVRNLEGTERCPGAFWGEVHQDGVPWSSALWAFRKRAAELGKTPADIDRAVYTGMTMIPGDADLSGAGTVMTAAVRTALGDAAATALGESLTARGVTGCKRYIPYDGARDRLYFEDWGMRPWTPGNVQLVYSLTETATSLTVHADKVAVDRYAALFRDPGRVAPIVLVKRGAPIVFSYPADSTAASDAAFEVPLQIAADGTGSATILGGFAPGDYYVSFVNAGDERGVLRGVTLAHVAGALPPDAAVPPDGPRDAGVPAATDAGAPDAAGGAAGVGAGAADAAPVTPPGKSGGCQAAPVGSMR